MAKITNDKPERSILLVFFLFLIYVNDLTNASKISNPMFSDHNNIFFSHDTICTLSNTVN